MNTAKDSCPWSRNRGPRGVDLSLLALKATRLDGTERFLLRVATFMRSAAARSVIPFADFRTSSFLQATT